MHGISLARQSAWSGRGHPVHEVRHVRTTLPRGKRGLAHACPIVRSAVIYHCWPTRAHTDRGGPRGRASPLRRSAISLPDVPQQITSTVSFQRRDTRTPVAGVPTSRAAHSAHAPAGRDTKTMPRTCTLFPGAGNDAKTARRGCRSNHDQSDDGQMPPRHAPPPARDGGDLRQR
jgi:hypothetical protein